MTEGSGRGSARPGRRRRGSWLRLARGGAVAAALDVAGEGRSGGGGGWLSAAGAWRGRSIFSTRRLRRASGLRCLMIQSVFAESTIHAQLLGELNAAGMQMDYQRDWDRTSLEKYIRFFRTSFLQPMLKACKEELESAYRVKLQQSKNTLNW
ncbi:hypothetical protein ACQ4PT_017114 [Festuca glaucescens]